ncbi:pyocin knob domain-containing protein, partial [Lactococcus cremoris]
MSYEKQTWNKYDELKTEEENIENGAVVTDNRMNHMETGIGDNDANLASHLADKNNPHKVTAAQVGLDKVDNVKQASKVEFDSHINNKSNPHAVTASQVGAYTKAESDSKLTDLSNKVIANKGNLASGTDLDNVIDIGTYRIGGLTGGTDIINVPSERSGTTIYAYLTVSGTTTSVVQELIVYDSKTVSQIYSRSRSGSTPTFSPWSKTVMADDSGKVTVSNTIDSGQVKTATINTGYGRS